MKPALISLLLVLVMSMAPLSALAGASNLFVVVFCDEILTNEHALQDKITANPYDWYFEWKTLYDDKHGDLINGAPSPPHIQSIGIEKNDARDYGYYFGVGNIDSKQGKSIEQVCGSFPRDRINSDLRKWSKDITSGFANVPPSDFIVVPYTTETLDILNNEDGVYVVRRGDWIVTHKSYCSKFCYVKSTSKLVGRAINFFLNQFAN